MTKEEFINTSFSSKSGLVNILLNDGGIIARVMLREPCLYESAPKEIYQSPDLRAPKRFTNGTPPTLLYYYWVEEVVHSPTSWTPAQQMEGSVELAKVKTVEPAH